MTVIDKAHEAVAQDCVGQAVKLLAGMSAPKRKAVLETLRLAVRLDHGDRQRLTAWLATQSE